ncbi:MAG: DEAD/DEAH box helicase [Cytophagaceae bacterium]
MLDAVKNQIKKINTDISGQTFIAKGEVLLKDGNTQILCVGDNEADVLLVKDLSSYEVTIKKDQEEINYYLKGKKIDWDELGVAALMTLEAELEKPLTRPSLEGKSYTHEGMKRRALKERQEKAAKADYKITFADNIYGEHTLINDKGAKYKVTLRDFKNETGYIDNPDWKTNKLGTTKHIMFVFSKLKSDPKLYKKLSKTYPFVEVYTDPLNDYRITWHYPHPLEEKAQTLIEKHFGNKKYIDENNAKDFLPFLKEAIDFPEIKIRPEVEEKVQKAWDNEILQKLKNDVPLDFSCLKVKLFPYQEEGIKFATFRSGAILADEMGLGKTVQAVGTAVLKKKIFNFKRTLIICPASLKSQWTNEINKFCSEEAQIAEGTPTEREAIYNSSKAFFIIINYETVLRDFKVINKMNPDFIILDEAQKIKNFTTLTAQSIKLLKKKHSLVLTGTPMENRLTDLYSIVHFTDPDFLTPLWEFSHKYCYFDSSNKNKITGYFNLQDLNERLKPILLRREKRNVLKDLPSITEINVPVPMHMEQQMHHANCAKGIAAILRKKYISPFDQQRLMLLLNNMRMVCDSTFLVDKETFISPKLNELKEILTEKLQIQKKDSKVIIFSEWVTMLNLIEKVLQECQIGYTTLSGKVAVKDRNALVKKFESDPKCKVFLSSEAGGAGLNLQVADTVINFELPWNPAKKNQRLGRIDRLGQRSKKLTIINFITRHSIEENIASGISLKQNLFEGVLNTGSQLNEVDFSASGKAQFLQELEHIMQNYTSDLFQNDEPEEDKTLEEQEDTYNKLDESESEASESPREAADTTSPSGNPEQQFAEMEKVMNNGMQFLSGLFKMATGKDIGMEDQKVEINKETGEVTMKFKMPKM